MKIYVYLILSLNVFTIINAAVTMKSVKNQRLLRKHPKKKERKLIMNWLTGPSRI